MRKKYAEEYKNAAVNMVLIEGKSPTEVAHNLGICVSLLHKWIRKHKGMDSKGKLSNSEEEIKRLKKENQELKKRLATSEQYREILKNDARLMAIWHRKPPNRLIWHTDRGSQYASKAHRALLKTHHIQQSMSRKRDCWDNAVAESFFHTLKTELVFHERYKTRQQAHASVFGYIEVFYNRKPRHSANNLMSPANFETVRKVA